jgi:hypothetical protein
MVPTLARNKTPDYLPSSCSLVNLVNIPTGLYSRVRYNERSYNEQFLSIKSGCYNEHRCYNKRAGILSADVARACAWGIGPPGLIRVCHIFFLSVSFIYQFSSVICAFSSENIIFKLFYYIILSTSRQNTVRKLDGNFALGCGPGKGLPLNTYMSMYARMNEVLGKLRSLWHNPM